MSTTNRTFSKKSSNAFTCYTQPSLLKLGIFGLSILTSTLLPAQENTSGYAFEDSPAIAYISPFKEAPDDGYKVVYYEEGMSSKLEEKTNLILEDIFFGYGDDQIQSSAERVLTDLVRILRDNPEIAIELSAYTDSRGTTQYNERLSRKRATNMVKYLTKKGISASRLLPVGGGESNPRNNCYDGMPCTEEQYRENRRIEMRTARIINTLPLRNYIYKEGK